MIVVQFGGSLLKNEDSRQMLMLFQLFEKGLNPLRAAEAEFESRTVTLSIAAEIVV